MASLSIFANFFIDTEENFIRMKDSFKSFASIRAEQWIVNIRGSYREESMSFLSSHLGDLLSSFQLESEEGWFYDSRKMLPSITSSHVLFWIEDHLNLIEDLSLYDEIVEELDQCQADFMYYSFYWTKKRYEHLPKTALSHVSWLDLNHETFPKVLEKHPGTYIIGVNGIFSADLFRKIVMSDDEQQAIKWPTFLPFDFEKSSYDTHWLPIRMAFPEQELFASIDDDSIVPGSCLISRGLYPQREKREAMGRPTGISPIKYPI